MTRYFSHSLHIHLFANPKSFITLSTERTELRCF